jgi:hypothetical protein
MFKKQGGRKKVGGEKGEENKGKGNKLEEKKR